jgi:S-DNA-T family DNA segregation ATPase FtsK/SpoIIIE
VTSRNTAAFGLAITLYAIAGFLTASIALAFLASGADHLLILLLRAPGQFFVDSFHLAALYLPAVLLSGATMLLSSETPPRQIWVLLASVIPFFTVALIVRLIARTALSESLITATLVGVFGRLGALTLAVLTLAVEATVAWFVWIRRPRPIRAGTRRISALLAAPAAAHRAVPSRSLVDLPEPEPELKTEPEPEPELVVSSPDTDPAIEPEPEDEELELLFSEGRFARAADDDWDDSFDPDSFDEGVATLSARHSEDESDPDDLDLDELDLDEDEDLEEADDFLQEDDVEERLVSESETPAEKSPAKPEKPAAAAPVVVTDEPVPVPKPRSKRYDVPVEGLLQEYSDGLYWHVDDKTREAGETLRVTLEEFGIQAEVTGIRKGPVITMFEILPAPGVKLSKIVNLSDNIALRLAASSVRIVAPIPGKHAVGIEIPNKERAIVGFGDLVQEGSFQTPRQEIPIALGKDIPGDAQIVDLTRMPHVLIAGATGSGKSVCVNSIICSILYRRAPHEVKLILIDPKIVELKFYNDIPHLLTPVITDPKRAFQALQYCIYEMERRYSLLDALQVRDIKSYNKKIKARNLATEPLPYIVVVVDEFADLMATSGKELESTLARLAAMSRAVGIHLVLATQRPSTDVITGLIKANIPSRIAFMVASKVDSRIILDSMGAEKLLGRGDMLFTSAWDPFPLRMQGAFLSEEEVERVVTYVKQLGEPDYIDDEIFVEDEEEEYAQGELEDPLMEKAIEIVTSARKASASYLQRRLKVGYNRAARMVEEMERIGIVGPQQGSKPRDVIGSPDPV